MVEFNSVQNSGKWLDFSVKNNLKTILFATREFIEYWYLDGKVVAPVLKGEI